MQYTFCICSTMFMCAVQCLCTQFNVCICSTLFVYTVHCFCMQYTVCVCSKLFVYAVHSLCMQYTVCVCSTLLVYAVHCLYTAVHCLCMQYTVCVCSTLFVYRSTLFVYAVHCQCMRYTVCVCSTLFVYADYLLDNFITFKFKNSTRQPSQLEPKKKLTRHLLKLIRNLVKAPKLNQHQTHLKIACLFLCQILNQISSILYLFFRKVQYLLVIGEMYSIKKLIIKGTCYLKCPFMQKWQFPILNCTL